MQQHLITEIITEVIILQIIHVVIIFSILLIVTILFTTILFKIIQKVVTFFLLYLFLLWRLIRRRSVLQHSTSTLQHGLYTNTKLTRSTNHLSRELHKAGIPPSLFCIFKLKMWWRVRGYERIKTNADLGIVSLDFKTGHRFWQQELSNYNRARQAKTVNIIYSLMTTLQRIYQ